MSSLKEAFQEFDELDDVLYDIDNKADLDKLKKSLDSDEDDLDGVEKIVDINAESEEDLEQSYVGKIVLYCPFCHTIHCVDKEDIVENEETPQYVNVGEQCPECNQTEGFEIAGKVAPADDEQEGKEQPDEEQGEEDVDTETDVDLDTKFGLPDEDGEDDDDDFEESLHKTKKSSFLERLVDNDCENNKLNFDDNDGEEIEEKVGSVLPRVKKRVKENLKSKKPLNENLTEAPIYGLEPRYDARKSFYGKAQVDTGDKGDKNKLYSYDTLVAEIKDGKPVVYGTYSQTTLRHIKDWLKQNGFKAESKAQIENDYMTESCDGKHYQRLKANNCDLIALTEYEGGDPVDYVKSDEDLEDWLNQNPEHSWFPVELEDDDEIEENLNEVKGRDDYFTDLGKQHKDLANELGLSKWYDPFSGNFMFNKADYEANKDNIDKWLNTEGTEYYGVATEPAKPYDDGETYGVEHYFGEEPDARAYFLTSTWDGGYENDDVQNILIAPKKKYSEDCKGDECKKEIKESKLNESTDNVLYDLIDRAKMKIDEGNDIDEAVWGAMDDGLIYTDDIYEFIKDYFNPDELYDANGEPILTPIMENVYGQIYDEVSDYYNEHKNGSVDESLKTQNVDTLKESVKTKLDNIIKEGLDKSKDDVEARADDKKEIAKEKEEKAIDDADADEDDELDEQLFDNLINKYCTRVYENVKDYKTITGYIQDDNLVLEGLLTFKSGKTSNTKFIFEKKMVKDNQVKYVGLNESFSKSKKAFTLNCKVEDKKIMSESLTYNYRVSVNKEKKAIYGSIKNN